MRRRKPKILGQKIMLAELLRKKAEKVRFDKSPFHSYWWKGVFKPKTEPRRVYVFFQYYVRRPGVHYVDIRWDSTHKALTVNEIKKLLYEESNI